MTAYSFTASRRWSPANEYHLRYVRNVLRGLEDPTSFATGGCKGGDDLIAQVAFQDFPDAEHTVILPANRSQVSWWWRGLAYKALIATGTRRLTIIEMPEGSSYRDRNKLLVASGDKVLGFPGKPSNGTDRGSGTWMTVRMAEQAGKLLNPLHILSELDLR